MKTGPGLFLLIFLSLFSSQPLNAETIRIVSIDYCPYQCNPETENGKRGYMAEVAEAIFEKAGYSVRFKQRPWKRAILETEMGESDALLCGNSNHSKALLFSKETSGILKQNFYVRKGETWKYDGVKSLEKIRVGSVIGYNYASFSPGYEAYLQANRDTTKVQYTGGDDAPLKNFRKILKGRITTFNEDAALFGYITMKAGIADKFDVAGSLGNNPQYMGFSPKNPNVSEYIEIFDNGIREMRKSGELLNILKKYGMGDWKND